ncbi:condensin complex subunit 3-like [Vitis riparia]|uniref:condensin complex subunit 3-like n=1 Tax=Vitis riparia TaxID=96939 RepID=UPI00155A2AE0|nr:condensin complex subunit 3-like [Vitis riparia]
MVLDMEAEKALMQKIARVLDESGASNAAHIRKLKDLSTFRSASSSSLFFSAFSKTLIPLFAFPRRTSSAERTVRFIATFASKCDSTTAFLEEFFRFLVNAATAANKTARFRACQMISEIIMRLPDDAEVSNELWDEVIECMRLRVGDKVPLVRALAVRALARFATDSENSDILDLFLEALPLEHNAEVRKMIVLSLPPSNATSVAILDHTLDVSEVVRKAAYYVLANKFPLQSLSIKVRTIILQRGLADRSAAVTKECLKLLKDEWLVKCCNGDPIELLKYLDVETYELVGESVMEALLKAGAVQLQDDQSIRQFIVATSNEIEGESGHCIPRIQLMEAEVALYWKTVCRNLQLKAQERGSDAAATMGTEAAVYAAEASDNNDLLDRVLPAMVSDYVELVKAHLDAGSNYCFASRQLLLLGAMLDFSDATNRKVASGFVQELLHKPIEYEVDEDGNKVVMGDGVNLGGDREWADAVSGLARKVHAAVGEFEEVLLGVVEELAQPCRERTADFLHWMHCLSVTGLLLENAKSFRWMQGKSIEPDELLQSLLLPGAKHVHLDVQRVATRCLGLFGLLERKPSVELVKQLRFCFIKGPSSISIVACKALIDIGMWHGPQEVDRAMGLELSSLLHENKMTFSPVNLCDMNEDWNVELLDLLYAGLNVNDWIKSVDMDENESVQAILGEGFAKILLLSENYPSIPASLHPLFLSKLIILYFSNETKELQRLKQCLSVFFEHYPSLSADHKKCISKSFMPVMRSMWPGINTRAGGSPFMVSNMRKLAVQASRFMLQMMQAPLYAKETKKQNENQNNELPEVLDGFSEPLLDFECGEEGLAIRIAAEVVSFHAKKTPAQKSYVSALCRVLVLLHFRLSEQGAIKLMRRLLNRVAESAFAEREVVKELKRMAERLKAIDREPDQELSQEQANCILGRLELELNFDVDDSMEIQPTPVSRSSRPARTRQGVRNQESSSEEELSPTSFVPKVTGTTNTRSQRASKIAALTKMTANRAVRISNEDDEEQGSAVTSQEDSDESDQSDE